jgi:Ca2+-binding EF-hand superfamily protein
LGDTKSQAGVEKLFNLYDTDGTGKIDFDKVKRIAKELGETMNDKELEDMMHHVHVLNRTETPGEITLEEFYQIVTKKLH